MAHPVDHNMTNHPPVTDDVVAVFDELRAAAKAFGHAIEELCPGSREKALAQLGVPVLAWSASTSDGGRLRAFVAQEPGIGWHLSMSPDVGRDR